MVRLEQDEWLDQLCAASLLPDWEEAPQTRFHPDPNIRALPSDEPVLHDGTTPIVSVLRAGSAGLRFLGTARMGGRP